MDTGSDAQIHGVVVVVVVDDRKSRSHSLDRRRSTYRCTATIVAEDAAEVVVGIAR